MDAQVEQFRAEESSLRHSASPSARITMWKCCRRSAPAKVWKTIPPCWPGARRVLPPPRFWIISRMISFFFVDESHVMLPQLRAMYGGDFARKKSLVDYGFRLPSAFDNRPLKFEEFEAHLNQTIFVSATPGEYERQHSGQIVEQVIRPTGLLDPHVVVKPVEGQIEDLLSEINARSARGERVLVTTLTKKNGRGSDGLSL